MTTPRSERLQLQFRFVYCACRAVVGRRTVRQAKHSLSNGTSAHPKLPALACWHVHMRLLPSMSTMSNYMCIVNGIGILCPCGIENYLVLGDSHTVAALW